jgi:hypothetical protein
MTGPTPLDPTPVLPGYTVRWDIGAGQWAATSDHFGTVLRGANQDELNEARWDLVLRLAEELPRVLRQPPARGCSPPLRRPSDSRVAGTLDGRARTTPHLEAAAPSPGSSGRTAAGKGTPAARGGPSPA